MQGPYKTVGPPTEVAAVLPLEVPLAVSEERPKAPAGPHAGVLTKAKSRPTGARMPALLTQGTDGRQKALAGARAEKGGGGANIWTAHPLQETGPRHSHCGNWTVDPCASRACTGTNSAPCTAACASATIGPGTWKSAWPTTGGAAAAIYEQRKETGKAGGSEREREF